MSGEDRPNRKVRLCLEDQIPDHIVEMLRVFAAAWQRIAQEIRRGPRDQERKTQRCGIRVQNPNLHFALSTEELSFGLTVVYFSLL